MACTGVLLPASAFGALAPQNLRVGGQHHRPPVSGALTPQKLRVGSRRHRPPIALVDTKIAAWDDYSTTDDDLVLGLPTIADLPDVASLLGECFFRTKDGDDAAAAAAAAAAASYFTPPTMPRDALGLPTMPPPPLGGEPAARARWRVAYKGLHWRVGGRLHAPSLASSLETSLLLVAQEASSRRTVGCAELSLRRLDGRLPGEFAVPPLFMDNGGGVPVGAYVSNLCAAPDYRRRGLGTRLLHTCEWVVASEWALPAVHLHVDMANDAARALYTRAGYEPLPQYDAAGSPQLRANYGGDRGRARAPSGAAPPTLNRFHRKSLSLGAEILRERTAAAIT